MFMNEGIEKEGSSSGKGEKQYEEERALLEEQRTERREE